MKEIQIIRTIKDRENQNMKEKISFAYENIYSINERGYHTSMGSEISNRGGKYICMPSKYQIPGHWYMSIGPSIKRIFHNVIKISKLSTYLKEK